MHRASLLLALLLATGLAACSADRPQTPAPANAPSAAAPTVPPGASAPSADVTMRYNCDGAHSVAVHGETSVTVSSADGSIELSRVPDSSPPQFADDALSFSIGTKGAELGHAGVGSFACRPE